MDFTTYLGPERNLLDESAEHAKRIEIESPLLENGEF